LEDDLKEMKEENCKFKENLISVDENTRICEFREIVVVEDFETENGVLGLDRDIYLSIVKFLDSSIVRKVSKYFIFLFILLILFLSTLGLVKNVINEWNTSTL
jgi:hypothetical protein